MEDYTAGLLCAMGPLTERVGVLRELLQRAPRVRGRGKRGVVERAPRVRGRGKRGVLERVPRGRGRGKREVLERAPRGRGREGCHSDLRRLGRLQGCHSDLGWDDSE